MLGTIHLNYNFLAFPSNTNTQIVKNLKFQSRTFILEKDFFHNIIAQHIYTIHVWLSDPIVLEGFMVRLQAPDNSFVLIIYIRFHKIHGNG